MNSETAKSTATIHATGRPPARERDRIVQHGQHEFAAARRRERADQRNLQAGERRELLDQLRRGRGVTDTLAAVAQPQDSPADHVRRARRLRDVLNAIADGTLILNGLSPRKAARFLGFLEREIAWLENPGSDRGTPSAPAPIAA